MATIVLAGWHEGLQKVALANLQHEMLHLPLKDAKENVDRLLEAEENQLLSQPVVLEVADEVAIEFFTRASSLGAYLRFPITSTKHAGSAPLQPAGSQQAA